MMQQILLGYSPSGEISGFAYFTKTSVADGAHTSSRTGRVITSSSKGDVFFLTSGGASTQFNIEGIDKTGNFKGRWKYSQDPNTYQGNTAVYSADDSTVIFGTNNSSNQGFFGKTNQPTVAAGGSLTSTGYRVQTTSYQVTEANVISDGTYNYFACTRGDSYDGYLLYQTNSAFNSLSSVNYKSASTRHILHSMDLDSNGDVWIHHSGNASSSNSNSYITKHLKTNLNSVTQYKSSNTFSQYIDRKFFVDNNNDKYFAQPDGSGNQTYWMITKYNNNMVRSSSARVFIGTADSFVACDRVNGGAYVVGRSSSKDFLTVYKLSSDLSSVVWSRKMGYYNDTDGYYTPGVFELISGETDTEGNLLVLARTQSSSISRLGSSQTTSAVIRYTTDGPTGNFTSVTGQSPPESDTYFKVESISDPALSGSGTYTFSSTTDVTSRTVEFTNASDTSSWSSASTDFQTAFKIS